MYVTDVLGNALEVGDEVTVAFPDGSSAVLRFGTIIGIDEKEAQAYNRHLNAYFPQPYPVLEIEWDMNKSGGFLPTSKKATKLERISGRVLKIN